ncbi:cathepsin B-like [Amyelois transitella]|uniref:cathepsin B-like n=1 Tax=Amyelois transitella TaxID=680683 RepID=UPI00298FDA98|nr:cathepsin B-like [Amyelois transitella]
MYFPSILLLFVYTLAAAEVDNLLSDEYIQLLNTKQSSWKAGRNYPEGTPKGHLPSLSCLLREVNRDDIPSITYDRSFIDSLPESFDARVQWKNCPSLKEIRDQGSCGSCWAFGAVEAMTDRWCIHSNGTQFHFSAQDMAGCSLDGNGCDGGYLRVPWQYWHTDGIVSGGNYNSEQGCKPYEIPECVHGYDDGANCTGYGSLYCDQKCRDGYDVSYEQDKKYGLKPYAVSQEDHIKADLYVNGPLEVGFIACPDLYHYKSGVYRSTFSPDNNQCGGHAVKVLGWGAEDGTKYWLLANSWNTYWGELGGFFKFLRGENHMGIESEAVGAKPKL